MATATGDTFPVPVGFNPMDQVFTMLDSTGKAFKFTITDMNLYRIWALRLAIGYATQFGASIILFLVLILITRREKRRSFIFIMNALCIALNAARTLIQGLYTTSSFYHPYAYFTDDYSYVPSETVATSVSANVLSLILVTCVMISLSLQVNVVLVTTPKWQRFWIMVVTTSVALLAIGVRFAVVVYNSKAIVAKAWFHMDWLVNTQFITQAIAIWTFCMVFTVKLGFAIYKRRKIGMRQFGPMQIIFIMGCQTMIFPGKTLVASTPLL